jgi:DNA repair exonuclease SbcCD ATPase subunit
MSQSARVTSIETVQRFRNALCEFGKDVLDTLCAADMQLRRTSDWLIQISRFWQREIRVRQEELTRAKIELTSRKYACRDGKGPGYTDQEKAFRKAQARLAEAESKLANCRRWKPLLEHAIREYQGPARQLSGAADADMQQILALLDQKLEALDAYLALAPPPTSDLVGAASLAGSAAPVEVMGSEKPVEEEPAPRVTQSLDENEGWKK